MSIFSRAYQIVEAKVTHILNHAEDPNAMLDLSYEKMLTSLQDVKSHLAEVVTEQKRLEDKIAQTKKNIDQYSEDAKSALKLNNEDLAKRALALKQQEAAKLAQLENNYAILSQQIEGLKQAEQKFQDRIEAFKTQKEITKANYTVAKTQVKMNESLSGVGKDLNNVGQLMDRANEKTEQMQARVKALDSLTKEGILHDPLDPRNSTQIELDQLRTGQAVDNELATMKKELATSQNNTP